MVGVFSNHILIQQIIKKNYSSGSDQVTMSSVSNSTTSISGVLYSFIFSFLLLINSFRNMCLQLQSRDRSLCRRS